MFEYSSDLHIFYLCYDQFDSALNTVSPLLTPPPLQSLLLFYELYNILTYNDLGV